LLYLGRIAYVVDSK